MDDDMADPKIGHEPNHDTSCSDAPKIAAEGLGAPVPEAAEPSASTGPANDCLPHQWRKCDTTWLCYVCMGISKGEPKRLTGCHGPPESWRQAWKRNERLSSPHTLRYFPAGEAPPVMACVKCGVYTSSVRVKALQAACTGKPSQSTYRQVLAKLSRGLHPRHSGTVASSETLV